MPILFVRRKLCALLAAAILAGAGLTATAQPMVYWTNTLAGSLHRTVIGSGAVENLIDGFVERPDHLALDLDDGKIYWSLTVFSPSSGNAVIQRANLDGSEIENLVFSGYCAPFCPVTAMAVDASANSIYWFTWDGSGPLAVHGLFRSNTDGSDVTFLGAADHVVMDVVLDPANGQMFWLDFSWPEIVADHAIRRFTLGGSNIDQVLHVFDGKPPSEADLALDAAGGKVYWVTDNRAVRRANLDGSAIEDLVWVEGDSTALADITVDPAGDKIYWSATYGGITTFPRGVIHRANLDGTDIETVLSVDQSSIGSFAIDFSEVVGTEETAGPDHVTLAPAYPNPAGESANVPYSLTRSMAVRLTVFDVLGREVRTLELGMQPPGTHRASISVTDLPSGVYVYRLSAGDMSLSRTLTVRR